jgi:hypothetical protein
MPMTEGADRLERLREAEARLAREVGDDDVARRLAAIRHDIELALTDIEATIASTRRAQDKPEDAPEQR